MCLGGNAAEGASSMYIVMVGPLVDLSLHPSHRVEIIDLETHSCQSDTACSAVQPCMIEGGTLGSLCCAETCGESCSGYDCDCVSTADYIGQRDCTESGDYSTTVRCRTWTSKYMFYCSRYMIVAVVSSKNDPVPRMTLIQ